VKFDQAMTSMQPVSVGEAMAAYRSEYGRGARRRLAQEHGVTPDTAGRWLSGKQAPSARSGRREQVLDQVPRNRLAAQVIRGAQGVRVGKVQVNDYHDKPAGSRPIGTLPVDAELREQLGEVADLVEQGELGDAEAALSEAIIQAYGRRIGGQKSIPRDTLKITDYPSLDFL